MMNNAAFRALVEERRAPKSSKEIAREAVEAEFRNKKKRGRGDGYSSDSSNEAESICFKKKEKTTTSEGKKQPQQKNETQQYRDRAKERREGKNVDYATTDETSSLLQVHAQDPDMSKYLGGDEAHTHLVKGLDRVLARKVRREMGRHFSSLAAQEESNWKKDKKHDATENGKEESGGSADENEEPSFPETAEEALKFVQQQQLVGGTAQPSSSLGRSMLDYLRYRFIPLDDNTSPIQVSSAGQTLQKSSLTFDLLHIDPRDRRHAWSVPEESVGTTTTKTKKESIPTANLQVLDEALLHRIRAVMEHRIDGNKKKADNPATDVKAPATTSHPEKDDEDISDDDIFADAGDDYVPMTAATSKKLPAEATQQQTNEKKTFFDAEMDQDAATNDDEDSTRNKNLMRQKQQPKLTLPKIAAAAGVIDRDLFGGKEAADSTQREKQPRAGLATAGNNGGYGEELDMDFDGSMEAEAEDGTKKKNKRKADAYLTVGAMEYGKSGKRKLKSMSDE